MKVLIAKIVFVALIILSPDFIFGNYSYKKFSKKEGLSNTNIYSIVQDKFGFIWVGTENGLNKFDGISFQSYFFDSDNENSICHNNAHALYSDSSGKIWIGTPGGISKYDYKKDKFNSYLRTIDSVTPMFSLNQFFEEDNCLYAVSGNGIIYRYNSKPDGWDIYKQFPVSINALAKDYEGNYFIVNDEGLFFYSEKDSLFSAIEIVLPGLPKKKIKIRAIHVDKDTVWLGTDGFGLIQYNRITGQFKQHNSIINSIYTIKRCLGNELWVCGYKGIMKYNNQKGDFEKFHIAANEEESEKEFIAKVLYEDRNKNLWVGVRYNSLGLIYKNKNFENCTQLSGSKAKLSKKIVTSVMVDGNNLWVGYYHSGIETFNLITGERIRSNRTKSEGGTLADGTVFSIFKDSKENIWVGTKDGLQRFIRRTGCFDYVLKKKYDVRSIAESKSGRLWFTAHGIGICRYDPETSELKEFISEENNEKTITNKYTFSLLFDYKGDLWITSAYGLSRMTPEGRIRQYFHNASDSGSLSNSFINSILEDSNNQLWIGTSQGLNKYDRENDRFIRYGFQHGFRDLSVLGILDDKKGNLWISTNEGLSEFETLNDTAYSYTASDGLISDEFNRNACFSSNEGMLYFAHIKGVTRFWPDQIDRNRFQPPVYISKIKLFNETIEIGDGTESILKQNSILTHRVEFQYNQNVITFEVIALNFFNAQENKYSYKLEGFDNHWHNIGSKRDITYTNLNPGKYRLRVIASNNDGIWNNEGVSLIVIIRPPFWKTWWFRAILVLLVLLLSLLFSYIRNLRIQYRNIELENIVAERTIELNNKNKQLYELNVMKDKYFSILAHDLRNPMNTIMGFGDLLKARHKSSLDEKGNSYLNNIITTSKKTYHLLENLLNWGRSQSGSITMYQRKLGVSDIIKYNLLQFVEQYENKNIRVTQQKPDNKYCINADKNMLDAIFRNLISNAIKFTNSGGKIELSCKIFEADGSMLQVSISDNGIGMSKKQLESLFRIDKDFKTQGTNNEPGNGFGLMLCKEYVEKHKGKIWAESKEKLGTTIHFTLPLFDDKV